MVQLREKRSSILQDLDDSSSSSAETPGKLFEIEDTLVSHTGMNEDEKLLLLEAKMPIDLKKVVAGAASIEKARETIETVISMEDGGVVTHQRTG